MFPYRDKTLRKIFRENLSKDRRSYSCNIDIRNLELQQKEGRVEYLDDFEVIVYDLNKLPESQDNQSANPCMCSDTKVKGSNTESPDVVSETQVSAHSASQYSSQAAWVQSSHPASQLSSKAVSLKSFPAEIDVQVKPPKSVLFMVDESNHIYRLQFFATNPQIVPLKIREQKEFKPENDKFTQSFCKEIYSLKHFPKHSKQLNYVQKYHLIYNDKQQQNRKNITPITQNITPKVITKNEKEDRTNTIASYKKDPQIASVIFIAYANFRFCLSPTSIMKIERVVLASSYKMSSAWESINEISSSKKGKLDSTQMTVFQNNNVFSISFCIEDPVFEKVVPIIQRGTSAPMPDLVYTRIRSMCDKKIFHFAGLPRSTYFYDDPMRMITRRNQFGHLKGLPPVWKTKMKIQEAKKMRKQKDAEMIDGAAKMGSCRLQFNFGNLIIKARSKVMKLVVDLEDVNYLKWLKNEKSKYFPAEVRQTQNSSCQTCLRLQNQVNEEMKDDSVNETEVAK